MPANLLVTVTVLHVAHHLDSQSSIGTDIQLNILNFVTTATYAWGVLRKLQIFVILFSFNLSSYIRPKTSSRCFWYIVYFVCVIRYIIENIY